MTYDIWDPAYAHKSKSDSWSNKKFHLNIPHVSTVNNISHFSYLPQIYWYANFFVANMRNEMSENVENWNLLEFLSDTVYKHFRTCTENGSEHDLKG